VALWDGWGLHRYSPTGQLLSTVEVPAQRVTSCAFGGADLSTLYITSASLDVVSEHAGSVFALDPGVTGMPAGEWAG
jgi:sugar lactone lactonase YvrE